MTGDADLIGLPSARARGAALWHVLRRVYRADRRRTVLALVPGWPLATGAVAIAGQSILRAQGRHDTGGVLLAAVIVAVATAASATIGYWQAANGSLRMAQVITTEIDEILLDHFGSMPTLEPFDDPERLDRLEILRTGRQPLTNVLSVMGGLTQLVAGLAVNALLLAAVRPWLAALPLLIVPVGIVYARTEQRLSAAERRVAERRRIALHLYDVGTGPAEGKELRVLGQRDALLDRHDATWTDIDAELSAVAVRNLLLRLAAWGLYGVVVAVVLARTLASGQLRGDSLFLLAVALGQLVFLAFNGAWVALGVRNAADIAGHLAATVDRVELSAPADRSGRPALAAPARIEQGIDLDRVGFGYGGGREVLGPIDLHLPAGSVTALVGHNGAGKTTLVNLLLGLRHPTAGAVRVDGADLRTFAPEHWYEQASVVCQDFVRFELAVREAVGAGDLRRIDDPDAVAEALRRAEAAEFVDALPDRADTVVGAHVGGRDLSGGQWQRLAMARGLMRAAPLLLVLDEPTVSMDAITEHRLLERCVDAARQLATELGTIVVFVSHRYATARLADQIVVLDGGIVAERGTHAELLAADGQYAHLYRRQADAYRR